MDARAHLLVLRRVRILVEFVNQPHVAKALEAIERLEPSLDIEEEQPHVLHWQTKKPSVAREEFGGHGVGSTTKGKGGKCFKCQQVGHWAAECPN